MPLNPRPRGTRDVRLYILALEGEESGIEYKYFKRLKSIGYLAKGRVKVVELPTPRGSGTSSPNAVLRRLEQFVTRNFGARFVEKWLVFDVDSWGEQKISTVSQQGAAQGFKFAISNSCFELWALLHIRDVVLSEFDNVTERRRSKKLKQLLGAARDGWVFLSPASIERACQRASQMTVASSNCSELPTFPGTFVNKIFDSFKQAGVVE